MDGLHLCAEWHDCAATALLRDRDTLREAGVRAAREAGLSVVGEVFHAFPEPGGVTGVVLLAESHLALHTWPELAAVTLDVYVCNRSGDHSRQARQVLATLRALLSPARVEEREIMRGALGRPPAGPPASPA
ncbi:MAG: adenosylmethionine decarboxylase [Sphaerotilus sulfidivorans]|jgi:S-adenosylmethionine decarboxylase proenzyme|uniref:adenosylmethionine decarboxylase n=1 Tax=Sphaerotilus sulfidivorans TaxID=639200 RepID=UPI003F2AFFDF